MQEAHHEAEGRFITGALQRAAFVGQERGQKSGSCKASVWEYLVVCSCV
jgi:hypothetical protein